MARGGAVYWIKASGIPQYDEDGNGTGIIGITQDITPEKETEARKNALITVIADREKIEHVIANLPGNAIQYSPVEKEIEIGCKKQQIP